MSQYLNRAAGEVWERLQPLFDFPDNSRPRDVYDAGDADGMDYVRRTFENPEHFGRVRNSALLSSGMNERSGEPFYDVLLLNADDDKRQALLGQMLTEGAHSVLHISRFAERLDWPGCREVYFGSFHPYIRSMLSSLGCRHATAENPRDGRKCIVTLTPESTPDDVSRFVGYGLADYMIRNAADPLPLKEIFHASDDKAGVEIVRKAAGNLLFYMTPEDMRRYYRKLERFVLYTGLDAMPTRDPSSRIVRGGVGRGS